MVKQTSRVPQKCIQNVQLDENALREKKKEKNCIKQQKYRECQCSHVNEQNSKAVDDVDRVLVYIPNHQSRTIGDFFDCLL